MSAVNSRRGIGLVDHRVGHVCRGGSVLDRRSASVPTVLLGSGQEAVAQAGFGDQVAGAAGFGFELAAQLGEVDAQVAALGVVGVAADDGEQFAGGDESAGLAQQDFEDAPFGAGEMDGGAVGSARGP